MSPHLRGGIVGTVESGTNLKIREDSVLASVTKMPFAVFPGTKWISSLKKALTERRVHILALQQNTYVGIA